MKNNLDNLVNDLLNGNNKEYVIANCLNLLPQPRTEQEILKDFEKLGWELTTNDYYGFIFKNKRNEFLKIYNLSKTYRCECNLSMQEHKLLNELFECWGWL